MKLFVGLGNPGGKYSANRHNVGFMAVDRIAQNHGFSNWRKRFQGETAEGTLDGEKVILLKPATFMNDSGKAVGAAVRYLKIDLADVVVFYDEIDLAAAKLKVKTGGGNAGHNGLRSITHLVGNDYMRVRIGVGHPGQKELVAGYVLHDFARSDREWLDPMLDAICDASSLLASDDAARFLSDVAQKLNPGEPDRTDKNRSSQGKSGADSSGKGKLGKGKLGKDKSSNRSSRDAGKSLQGVSDDTGAEDATRRLDSNEPEQVTHDGILSKKKSRHPSGDRQSKRQNALAENLRKWQQSRGTKK